MKKIEFLRITPLRGPNIWTYRPALEAWVDIGTLEDFPSNTLPGFVDRLIAWLPSLSEHRCGIGEPGGFLLRLREGTWAAHILEHVTIELQNQAGMQTGFGKARETSRRGVYKVVVRSRNEAVSRAAIEAARDLILAAIDDRPFDVPATIARLRELANDLCLGPSTACIVDAAAERGIPSIRLTEGNLVQLGYGARSRRIWTAETDRTGAIAETISMDKDLTKSLLKSCGVPVPEGRAVDSPEDAWEAARDIDGPVVVKPTDANHGRGVFTNLTREEEVRAAYLSAAEEGSSVIVERFVPGNEHRLLVVGNRMVAAMYGKAAIVVGDGRSTIVELIESQFNSDPRCGEEEGFPLEPIKLEREPIAMLELERQGFGPDSIPPAGKEVLVLRHGNLAYDCTDEVHPGTAKTVCLAARMVGLDIAGIDLVAEDISRPLEEQRGAIVEVNAGPGLLMHLKPAEGKPRPVGEAIANHLFAEEETGRIPVVGVSGSCGMTAVARLVAHLLSLDGKHTGLACGDGLYLDQRRIESGDQAAWEPGQRLLMNRTLEAAVFESGPRAILDEGLPYDRCQVGVVTNLDPAALLPDRYIDDPEHLYNVLRTQVDLVLPGGAAVLNADDPWTLKMTELSDGEVILFSRAAGNPAIAEHLARGGRAVLTLEGRILLATGTEETLLTKQPECATESILAAVAAAWALGLSIDLIRTGIETFALSETNR